MSRRLPSIPPVLPGFTYVRVLGSGGFADVYLYEQNAPRRQVAVKVLLADAITPQLQQMFQAEANVMAKLSSHPSILTVFQTGIASDGRPYLVMELCSSALAQSYRVKPLAVTDALRIGIQIAGALETAHRSGVLHRDIKPSNILITAYGHPVLSDFGIAGTLGDWEPKDAVGLSVPWSAPEMLLGDTAGSIDTEVWSLAATIYTLLAGRSPFEVPGKENTPAELASRITRGKPQPIGRPDVPGSLEAVLERAMSKKPGARQGSVLELLRDLQAVERELGLTQTRAEIETDEWAEAAVPDEEDKTLVRPAASARPQRRRRVTRPGAARSASTGGSAAGSASLAVRPRLSRAMIWALAACAVVVIALGATSILVLVRAGSSGGIPVVHDITGRAIAGTVVFRWDDPGLADGDAYQVQVGDGAPSIQHATEFRVDGAQDGRVCITVTVNRDGVRGTPSNPKCVDAGQG